MHDSTPETSADPAALQRALEASARGDSTAALALLEQAVLEQPDSGMPYFLMGSELAALGQMEQAELCLARAVLLAPRFPLARYQLGLLQFSSGRAALGLASWQPLLELGADSALPHFVQGFAALAGDRFAQARAHFEAGIAVNTEHPAVSQDIRKVLAALDAQAPQQGGEAAQAAEAAPSSHVLLANYRSEGPLH